MTVRLAAAAASIAMLLGVWTVDASAGSRMFYPQAGCHVIGIAGSHSVATTEFRADSCTAVKVRAYHCNSSSCGWSSYKYGTTTVSQNVGGWVDFGEHAAKKSSGFWVTITVAA